RDRLVQLGLRLTEPGKLLRHVQRPLHSQGNEARRLVVRVVDEWGGWVVGVRRGGEPDATDDSDVGPEPRARQVDQRLPRRDALVGCARLRPLLQRAPQDLVRVRRRRRLRQLLLGDGQLLPGLRAAEQGKSGYRQIEVLYRRGL